MKTLKNKIFAGAFALASLELFGAENSSKAQECQTYNHDGDEFYEEVICYKTSETGKKNDIERYTLINYSDEDNDNFYESIKVFNCDMVKKSEGGAHIIIFNIEDFYVDKSTGLIDYSKKESFISLNKWNKHFANKKFIELVKEGLSDQFDSTPEFYPYLTPQKLYEMGIDERVKTLINTCESRDISEIKRLTEVERNYFKANY